MWNLAKLGHRPTREYHLASAERGIYGLVWVSGCGTLFGLLLQDYNDWEAGSAEGAAGKASASSPSTRLGVRRQSPEGVLRRTIQGVPVEVMAGNAHRKLGLQATHEFNSLG